MTGAQDAIDAALNESQRLRKALSKKSSKQVHSDDEKKVAKATAQSWFFSHRSIITPIVGEDSVKDIDEQFKLLISATNRATSRGKYIAALKQIEKLLGQLQAERVVELASHTTAAKITTTDAPPNFSTLVSDAKMQAILVVLLRRTPWLTCPGFAQVGYFASFAA